MNYQEQVDAMLANLAEQYGPIHALELVKALGQGIAKATCLLPSADLRQQILAKAFVAIENEAAVYHEQFLMVSTGGVTHQTVPVFIASLEKSRPTH